MSNMQFAIDVGSGFTQLTDGRKEMAFPSLVCGVDNGDLGFGSEKVEIVEFKDKWLTGVDAQRFGEPPMADTLREDWAGSEEWMVLLYSALSRAGVRSGTVDLVTGLPQAWYARDRERIARQLAGEHVWKVNGKKCSVVINPIVIPQAVGAYFFQASIDDKTVDYPVGVIDIGTYTTGYSVVDRGNFVRNRSGGCELGVSTLAKALIDHLEQRYGHRTDVNRAPELLMERKILHRGDEIDIGEDVDALTLQVTGPLLSHLRKSWGTADDLLVYLAGGGAPYFEKAIRSLIPHAKLMADPFWAVVRGMLVYLRSCNS